jgi:hypothetical protein
MSISLVKPTRLNMKMGIISESWTAFRPSRTKGLGQSEWQRKCGRLSPKLGWCQGQGFIVLPKQPFTRYHHPPLPVSDFFRGCPTSCRSLVGKPLFCFRNWPDSFNRPPCLRGSYSLRNLPKCYRVLRRIQGKDFGNDIVWQCTSRPHK